MALVNLPDDIFRYILFPLIPNTDRIELNRALPRSHRVVGSLGKRVLEFELLFTASTMKRAVDKCLNINEIPLKREAILNLLRSYKSYIILFQYSHKIRCHFVRRINFLIDHDTSTHKTEEYMTELKRLRDEIFPLMIHKYRYKKDITFVNGNLPSY